MKRLRYPFGGHGIKRFRSVNETNFSHFDTRSRKRNRPEEKKAGHSLFS
jgi:hypothetical protein